MPNGYEIMLGNTFEQLVAILQDLEANKWIDIKTRLVAIDFIIYNGNINLFSQIR